MKPPEQHPERYSWMLDRAEKLAYLNDMPGFAEMIDYLWRHPDEYAAGNTYNENPGIDEELYALIRFCIAFGIEYEREYPTGGDWRDRFSEQEQG